jgi:hypothetical protein
MAGHDVWGWNYTTVLDIIAIAVFAALYWLYRNRARFGGGTGYAKDPVCGMQVQVAHAPAAAQHEGTAYYFCSDHCQHRFTASPARWAAQPADHVQADADAVSAEDAAVDPVCGMTVDPAAAVQGAHGGETYYFCGSGCRDQFASGPGSFTRQRARR